MLAIAQDARVGALGAVDTNRGRRRHTQRAAHVDPHCASACAAVAEMAACIPCAPAATAGGDGLLDHALRDAPGVSAVAGAAAAAMPATAAAASPIRRLDTGSSATQLSKAARRGIELATALHAQADGCDIDT